MKRLLIFLLVTILAANVQAQTKRLASYYCTEDNVSYSLNFFSNNVSYFVYTDAAGKQVSFQPTAQVKEGEIQYQKKGDLSTSFQVKKSGDDFPEKLKGRFTVNGKTIKLVFRKNDNGIVD